MTKYCLLLLVFISVRIGFAQESAKVSQAYVQPGEVLNYKISYGFLSIGEAIIKNQQHATGPFQKPVQDPMATDVGPADNYPLIAQARERHKEFMIPANHQVIKVTITPHK